jgi:hypothetical protein
MSIVVFLGPTLPQDEARSILDATYLPPVSMGKVLAVVPERPRAIVIIDGIFERTPAVWHKEILYALSRGIRVIGASSMGALRAAELERFGMKGVGRVFEMYRDGILEDDDEVAVAHADAEEGYRCISDAMVSIREGLAQAHAQGAVSQPTREILTAAAKARFYSDRTWADLFEPRPGVPAGELDRLRAFVRGARPDVKRSDAVAALKYVAAADLAPHRPNFVLEQTPMWRGLLNRESRIAGVRVSALSRRIRATHPDRLEILRGAARLAGLSWLPPRVPGRDATELSDLDGIADTAWRHQAQVDRFLPAELARRGVAIAEAMPPAELRPSTPEERVGAESWYAKAYGDIEEGDREAHALALRFASWDDLMEEVAAARRQVN